MSLPSFRFSIFPLYLLELLVRTGLRAQSGLELLAGQHPCKEPNVGLIEDFVAPSPLENLAIRDYLEYGRNGIHSRRTNESG